MRNRLGLTLLLCSSLSAQACLGAPRASETPPSEPATDVSLERLLADPGSWEGRRIRISGFVRASEFNDTLKLELVALGPEPEASALLSECVGLTKDVVVNLGDGKTARRKLSAFPSEEWKLGLVSNPRLVEIEGVFNDATGRLYLNGWFRLSFDFSINSASVAVSEKTCHFTPTGGEN